MSRLLPLWRWFVVLLFVGTAAFCFARAYLISGRYRWFPVHQPITLTAGTEVNVDFPLDFAGTEHRLLIECDRLIPFYDLNRLLDERLDVDYVITQDGHSLVADRWPPDFGKASTNTTLAAFLCKFPGGPSPNCHLHLHVNRTVPELNALHPRVRVTVDYLQRKGRDLFGGLWQLAGLASSVLAVVCFGIAVRRLLRVRRGQSPPATIVGTVAKIL